MKRPCHKRKRRSITQNQKFSKNARILPWMASKYVSDMYGNHPRPTERYPEKALHRWRWQSSIVLDDEHGGISQKYRLAGRTERSVSNAVERVAAGEETGETTRRILARGGWLWHSSCV